MNSKFLILSFFVTINVSSMLAQKSDQGSTGSSGGTNIMERSATRSTSSRFTVQVQIRDNAGHEVACIDSELFQYYTQLLAPGTYTAIYTNYRGSIIARTEFLVEE